jgi:hypothetical protein
MLIFSWAKIGVKVCTGGKYPPPPTTAVAATLTALSCSLKQLIFTVQRFQQDPPGTVRETSMARVPTGIWGGGRQRTNGSVCRASKSPTFLCSSSVRCTVPGGQRRDGTGQKPAKTVTLPARKQMIWLHSPPPSSYTARSKNS